MQKEYSIELLNTILRIFKFDGLEEPVVEESKQSETTEPTYKDSLESDKEEEPVKDALD